MEAFSIVDRLVYGEWDNKPGDKITQGLNILVIVMSVALSVRGLRRIRSVGSGVIVLGFRRIRSLGRGVIVLLALAGVFFLSALWSVNPDVTEREACLYLIVAISAVGIASNLETNEFMRLVSQMCFWSAVISLGLLLVFPGTVHSGDDFRGIFSQKNVLGEAMAMGVFATLHGLRTTRHRRLRNLMFLVVMSVAALMSESATSCTVIFVFCGCDIIINLIRKGGPARILAVACSVLLLPVVLSAAAFPDTVLEMIGKDPTLTGRTEIWDYVMVEIYEKPLLGWGFWAFWSSPEATKIDDVFGIVLPQAHNGLLEMLLQVGLVGTAFLFFLWSRTLVLALRCIRTSEKALAVSALLLCVGILLAGISETVLLAPFEASTDVFLVTGLLCEKALRTSPQWNAFVSKGRRQPSYLPA
jgi:exopolysaccharide production protein ExoQ